MKPRTLIICVSLVLCGICVSGAFLQAKQLDVLREEGRRLRRELQEEKKHQEQQSAEANPASIAPSSELLRLRNEVSQLSRRERELTGVETDNVRLREQVAVARTNAAKALPVGYIRKSEARNMGYSSPEATLQTMLWALRNRDPTNFAAAYTPEIAAEFLREFQDASKSNDDFFEGAGAIPGMTIVERNVTGPDTMELKVEIVPGDVLDADSMRFRLINGEWKLDSK